MEEYIPFRKLKKIKPLSISHTSQRLLKAPNSRHSSQSKLQNNIMSQNVTQYEYMLSNPHLKQSYIKWATNLRGYDIVKHKQQDSTQYESPPPVFYKKTEIQQIRAQMKSKSSSSHINTAEFCQFFGKDSTNIPQNQLAFLKELRKLKQNEKVKVIHEHRFKNQGKTQSSRLPKLLKKGAIKKMKGINENDFQNELDGSHKFPEYSYKNIRDKNSVLLKLLSKHDRINSNISLPSLAWAVSLRDY